MFRFKLGCTNEQAVCSPNKILKCKGVPEGQVCHACCGKFYDAQTYGELVGHNEQFLRGNYCMSFYHMGPLVSDHANSSLKNLVELTKYDIFTVDGQNPKAPDGGKSSQRSYLKFYCAMTKDDFNNVVNNLKNDDNIKFVAYEESQTNDKQPYVSILKGIELQSAQQEVLTYDEGNPYTHVGQLDKQTLFEDWNDNLKQCNPNIKVPDGKQLYACFMWASDNITKCEDVLLDALKYVYGKNVGGKAAREYVVHQGRNYKVILGPRGGKYIRKQGQLVRLRDKSVKSVKSVKTVKAKRDKQKAKPHKGKSEARKRSNTTTSGNNTQ